MDAEETEMSSAHDDSGYRPPPPRQGEPQPYAPEQPPGGYAPPPPPPHQPPPAAPWHGPIGYPPPGDPHQASGYGYRPGGKGFFGALFDLSFDHMITTRLIRVVYVLAILLITLTSLFLLLVGLWALQFNWGKYFGVFLVPAAPLLWLFELVGVRLLLEFAINQFKITEHLKVMRERGEPS